MKHRKRIIIILMCIYSILVIQNQKLTYCQNPTNEVLGFGILKRIPGLWHGPVTSTTPAGSYSNWYVDFRPVSGAQISQFSLLDSQTVNDISFFIVKHNNLLKVAMRTKGCFGKKCCVTYEVIDSTDEQTGYYRFCDFKSGLKRAYTEFQFHENAFVMQVYTNKFNTQETPQIHTRWNATLGDRKAASAAITRFQYPQKNAVKDFSDVFGDMTETIYYTFENDPYSSEEQPYTGSVTININISEKLKIKKNHELFLLLTTETLFDGIQYKKENLKYISKYVYLPAETRSFTMQNVHPGKYYLYSYNDVNGDRKHQSGDYMSSDVQHIINVPANGNTQVNTTINFKIP